MVEWDWWSQNYFNKFMPKLYIPHALKSDKNPYQTDWFKIKNDDVVSCIPTVGYDFTFTIKG